MKNYLLCLLAVVLLLPQMACKKDGGGSNTFSCKIDGTEFSVDGLGAYATDFSDHFTVYGILDVAGNSSANLVYISLPLDATPGTYTLNADNTGYYIDGDQRTFSNLWGQGSGTVVVEEIDEKHVRGTFEFTAFNSDNETLKKTLTDGKFDVEFR